MNISILLERALPLSKNILERIESGELTVFGGTIRDQAGRIVKHLVFPPDGQSNQKLIWTNYPSKSIQHSIRHIQK